MMQGDQVLTAQLMGFVHAMKTGNPTLDMILAFLVPIAITHSMGQLKVFFNWLSSLLNQKPPPKEYCTRTIAYHSSRYNGGGETAVDQKGSHNIYLVKAIKMYVHKHVKLSLDHADMELTSLGVTGNNQSGGIPSRRNRKGRTNGTLDLLEQADVIEVPKRGVWYNVGTFGPNGDDSVLIRMEDSLGSKQKSEGGEDGDSKSSSSSADLRTVEIVIQSTERTSINEFVQKAYQWYLQELKDLQDNDRFMFDLQVQGSGLQYRKFKLGDDKTFETLFSQSSHALLRNVDHFRFKTGKYAIKGYPHKLGLLLSGPPGTGKTSLIKALAHYTNRHIVNIPLSRIQTNAQLMNIFFSNTYVVNGEPHHVSFEDVIFVMEDVDASSEVVCKRNKNKKKKKPEQVELKATPDLPAPLRRGRTSYSPADKLNLSGLLNVLDGVVETPGRMCILTTNHPEKLDPALIRPGRIDKHLVLSSMVTKDVVAMLMHYYGTNLTEQQTTRIRRLVEEERIDITPAKLEQMTAEKDENVDDLLDALEGQLLANQRDASRANTVATSPCSDSSSDPTESDRDAPQVNFPAPSLEDLLEMENCGDY